MEKEQLGSCVGNLHCPFVYGSGSCCGKFFFSFLRFVLRRCVLYLVDCFLWMGFDGMVRYLALDDRIYLYCWLVGQFNGKWMT